MQNFLSLSKSEQEDLLSRVGNILISSSQGNTTTTLYSLYGFFIKTTTDSNGMYNLEALPNLDNLRLNNSR